MIVSENQKTNQKKGQMNDVTGPFYFFMVS